MSYKGETPLLILGFVILCGAIGWWFSGKTSEVAGKLVTLEDGVRSLLDEIDRGGFSSGGPPNVKGWINLQEVAGKLVTLEDGVRSLLDEIDRGGFSSGGPPNVKGWINLQEVAETYKMILTQTYANDPEAMKRISGIDPFQLLQESPQLWQTLVKQNKMVMEGSTLEEVPLKRPPPTW